MPSVASESKYEGRDSVIIAVDFDGILAEDNGQFPAIGPPMYRMVSFVRELIDEGHEVILWTSRTDKALEDAVTWCEDRGLHFCAVNENAPSNIAKYAEQYPNGTRKVSADVYIDDHNPEFILSLRTETKRQAINTLIANIREVVYLWNKIAKKGN